jgi:hypothetical protein
MWYRMRLLVLHLWNNWSRLTLYQRWQGPDGERLDGTNNACERAIGWGGARSATVPCVATSVRSLC